MKNNLESLKYIVTYTDDYLEILKRSSFSNYDAAYGYYQEKKETYGDAKLFIEQTITTEIRIK